jgi:ABC-type branched-subunit amino acid transport system ATPase component
MTLLDIAVSQSSRAAVMTFEELVAGCTPDEREQLAWHLAQMRARRTYEALRKATP